ncbi:hypothetical protein SAMN04489761_4250 [Tenacibaculum sp. MAR_2009_124]|uniref:hypothetical protein n=1 Tax=Tenacibaculum sp. MAR_2009_124 TaxID=1250059 RepID=UPI00089578C3|nr:hypothetical protein [Tenacibaculum sp. MAR_2009_124]SED09310.1 hypothetical protein SAMN04489761_4250 [Tenacibaculum sp. MAR_2009_124]
MKTIDKTFENALKHLIDKGVTAYEVHKFSGQSQTGLRKVFEGVVENPRRKTKEVIIEFYNDLLEIDDKINEKNVEYTKGLEKFTSHQISTYIVNNPNEFNKEELMKVLFDKSVLEEANKIVERRLKEVKN